MVRTSSLRRVFVSVKGYYFQAEVQGQIVTWLVPHPLAQVLPNDVDYKVMLTFLELYSTMVRFVLAKMYHDNGLKYPPVLEASLEEAGTGLQAIVHQNVGDADGDGDKKQKQKKEKPVVNNKNKKMDLPQASKSESEEVSDEIDSEEEEDIEEGIDQRLKSLNAKVQQLQQEIIAGEDDQGTEGKKQKGLFEAGEDDSEDEDLEIDSGSDDEEEADYDDDEDDDEGAADPEDADIPAAKIKGTITLPTPDDDICEEDDINSSNDNDDDDSAVFSTLFKGLVFFLGREVPKEQLLIVIRSFGGEAGWEGEGSPIAKSDPTISHQIMDRPPPSAADGGLQALYNDNSRPGGGRRREFIQPQWVFDSANARVLVRGELYAPGKALPPHLSPFVNEYEEGYVPEYGQQLKELREAALAAKRASSQKGGGVLGSGGEVRFIGEKKGGERGGGDDDGETEEAVYAAELAKELGGGDVEKVGKKRRAAAGAGDGDDQEALKDVMMTRKTKKMYATLKKQERAKKARVEELETKAKKLK